MNYNLDNLYTGPVSRYLRRGVEGKLTTDQLLQLTGCTDRRTLCKLIEMERADGVPIVAAPGGGYHLPGEGKQGRDEAERCYRTIRSKGLGTLSTARVFRRVVRAYDQAHSGQESVFEAEAD